MTQTTDSIRQCQRVGREPYRQNAVMNSSLDACKRIQEEMRAVVTAYAFTKRDSFAIDLAVEEALVNAVLHGNSCDPSRKIKVAFAVGKTEFRVQITDEGSGFDPVRVRDPTADERIETPNGRGLMLMRSFMTGVRHNRTGNSVEMWLLRANSSSIGNGRLYVRTDGNSHSRSRSTYGGPRRLSPAAGAGHP